MAWTKKEGDKRVKDVIDGVRFQDLLKAALGVGPARQTVRGLGSN
jgi:hypothetical protein